MFQYNKTITTALFYLIFVIGVIYLIFDGFSFFTFTSFAWFVISFIIFKIIDKRKIHSQYKLLVVVAVWLNLMGMIFFYRHFSYYDKILHFAISFFIAIIVYDYFVNNLNKFPKKFMVFLSSIGLLTIWEFAEYIGDVFFGLNLQGVFSGNGQMIMSPIGDTMIDLIVGALGAVMCLVFKKGKVI